MLTKKKIGMYIAFILLGLISCIAFVNERISLAHVSSLSSLGETLSLLSGVSSSVVSISAQTSVASYIDTPVYALSGQVKLGGASGILINKEGYILTSKHVVDDTRLHYQVRLVNGNMYKVDKIWLDPLLDLAVIKIAPLHGSLPAPVFFSLKQSARSGERVFIIGNAGGIGSNTITSGVLLQDTTHDNLYTLLYQTDAKAVPGNSGGPLVNLKGQIIGLVSSIDLIHQRTLVLPLSYAYVDAALRSIARYGQISN